MYANLMSTKYNTEINYNNKSHIPHTTEKKNRI